MIDTVTATIPTGPIPLPWRSLLTAPARRALRHRPGRHRPQHRHVADRHHPRRVRRGPRDGHHPRGTGTLGYFYYTQFPALTGISPAAGRVEGSDQEIVITGRNLAGAINVYFGSTRAVIQTISNTQITVRAAGAPAPGGVAVTVVTPGGSADGLSYAYLSPPTVTGVSPSTGPTTGGTEGPSPAPA
ncbi:IPT/TIG domain-containing protein [Streptomyces avermitilis]|uniref:IPT/TIG domain-containing protein n=1 Tax=Streptomyces avermitilis TaxID=33903 RepID=UPI0034012EF9